MPSHPIFSGVRVTRSLVLYVCFVVNLYQQTNEADFLQELFKNRDRKLGTTSNSSFHYINDVLSLNNSRWNDYLCLISPNKIEVKYINDR